MPGTTASRSARTPSIGSNLGGALALARCGLRERALAEPGSHSAGSGCSALRRGLRGEPWVPPWDEDVGAAALDEGGTDTRWVDAAQGWMAEIDLHAGPPLEA